MPDITTISAALSSIKAATDIAKFLRSSDLSLEHAELKLKLADMIVALADAKTELVDVQETLASKDLRIAELEDAFSSKDSLVRRYDAFYEKDANGKPVGAPYCLRCWESDHRKKQLVHAAKDYQTRVCTSCGHKYENRLAIDIAPSSASVAGTNNDLNTAA